MTALTVNVGGLTLGGDGPFQITGMDGWRGTPSAGFEDVAASDRHGVIATRGRVPARYVTLSGYIWEPGASAREAARAQFMRAFPPAAPSDVSVAAMDVVQWDTQVRAYVQVASAATVEDFRSGPQQGWVLQLRMPDPRVFLPAVTVTAPLQVFVPGLIMPFVMPGVMPQKPIGGLVVLTNPGNDPAGSPTTITLTGPQTSPGVAVLGTGKRAQYDFPLQSGDRLTIASATGSQLNGISRPTWLAGSDPVSSLALPPGQQIVQATGVATGTSASITVTVEPALWI